MLKDYEVTEDLLMPKKKEALHQNQKPEKTPMKNSVKIVLIVVAALVAIGAMFGYRAYAHSQYEKKLSLGEKYMDEGKTAQAKLAFEDAAQIEKKNPDPYILMGQMYYDNEDYDNAVKYAKQANDREETSRAYNNMGDAYTAIGNADKAEESYDKAEKIEKSEKSDEKQGDDAVDTEIADRGNSNANMLKGIAQDEDTGGGRVVQSGKWTYYCDGTTIMRCKNHDSETWETIIDGSSYSSSQYSSLNIYKNKLYAVSNDNDGEYSVVRMNLDGTDETTVFTPSGSSMGTVVKLLIYKNRLYTIWSDGILDSADLNGNDEKTVSGIDTGDETFGADSIFIDHDKIYYLNRDDWTFYASDIHGGTVKKVVDLTSIGFDENQSLGHNTYANGMYIEDQHLFYLCGKQTFGVYDLKTKEITKLKIPKGETLSMVNHDADYKHYYAVSVTSSTTDTDGEYSGHCYVWQFDADGGRAKKLYEYEGGWVGNPYLYVNDNGLFLVQVDGGLRWIDPDTGDADTILDVDYE